MELQLPQQLELALVEEELLTLLEQELELALSWVEVQSALSVLQLAISRMKRWEQGQAFP